MYPTTRPENCWMRTPQTRSLTNTLARTSVYGVQEKPRRALVFTTCETQIIMCTFGLGFRFLLGYWKGLPVATLLGLWPALFASPRVVRARTRGRIRRRLRILARCLC